MADSRPIGIFDSGVGGLTVVRAVAGRLPDESIVYLGDRARYPYGPRPVEEIRGFAVEIAQELVARDVKMLVIACNSVEVAAIAEVAMSARVPVVGVIDPGVRAAIAATRDGLVGLIGTEATIASGAYERAVERSRSRIALLGYACPAFVDLVEHGRTDGPEVREVVEASLRPLRAAGVDTLILGCTHYPLMAGVIGEVMGPEVVLVSSAEETAEDVAQVLATNDLAHPPRADGGTGRVRYLCTGDPEEFRALADRFLGHPVGIVEPVELPAPAAEG